MPWDKRAADPVLAQRTWLFNALKSDLEAKGQTDPAQLQQAREQIGRLSADELQTLVNLYQSLKQGTTPTQIYSEAVTDRDQSVVVRDGLRLELDLRSHLPSAAADERRVMPRGYAGGGYAGVALIGDGALWRLAGR